MASQARLAELVLMPTQWRTDDTHLIRKDVVTYHFCQLAVLPAYCSCGFHTLKAHVDGLTQLRYTHN